jgi:hypothetical protein
LKHLLVGFGGMLTKIQKLKNKGSHFGNFFHLKKTFFQYFSLKDIARRFQKAFA